MGSVHLSGLWRVVGAVVLLGLAAMWPAHSDEQPALESFVQRGVSDLSATVVLEQQDARELERMGNDFKNLYRFGKGRVQLMEPGRMRMDSRVGFFSVLYVVNQNRQMLAVPGIGVRTVKDISHSPASRQGLLELGVLSPSLLDAAEVEPLGPAEIEGVQTWRYALLFGNESSTRRQEIAVDPETLTLVERLVYHGDGRLKARYVYREPAQAAEGIRVPRRVEVHSPWGKRAAASRYEQVRVNTGLKEAAFAF